MSKKCDFQGKLATISEVAFGEAELFALLKLTFPEKKDIRFLINEILEKGDSKKVDMTVGDIYGEKCDFLPVSLLASTLANVNNNSDKYDMMKSLLLVFASGIPMTVKKIVCLLA